MAFRTGPPPPADHQLKLAIERTALYVAQNGPQSEVEARRVNYGNPGYQFLFNGEGSTFYQFCLAREINNLAQIAKAPPPLEPRPSTSQPVPLNSIPPLIPPPESQSQNDAEIAGLENQIGLLREQITQSERNLQAHLDSIPDQKKFKTEKLFLQREDERITSLMEKTGIVKDDFVPLIETLATSGSKDTISKVKHWIFDHAETDQKREVVLSYFLHRFRSAETSDNMKLHILYLINDWAYYCGRKKLTNIRQTLSRYVPKFFALATQSSVLGPKLDKLVGVWEAGRYLDDGCFKQLRNPGQILSIEQVALSVEKQKLGDEIEAELRANYTQYQKQHQEYEKHIQIQITSLRAKIESIKRQTQLKSMDTLDLKPKGAYYELPAGMIVPLIPPEEFGRKPLKPEDLRLPPPSDMNDALLAQVDRFYAMINTPRMEDFTSDGWDIRGLHEFDNLKAKYKEELIEKLKEEDKTLDDLIAENQPEYHRESDSESDSSSSSSSSSSRSSRSRSRSRTRSRSRSVSPEIRPSFSSSSRYSDGPPTFVKPSDPPPSFKTPLPPTNKGAQLLQRMGWEGGGLGADGKGRAEPVVVAPRDFQDQFRGVGSKPDEFEEYRKQMSKRFAN